MTLARLVPLVAILLFLVPPSAAQDSTSIAVIGTGTMGRALGVKLAENSHRVVYGSRTPDRDEVRDLIERTGHGATAATQADAASQCEIVILAVPWEPMEEILANLGDLEGKILVDITTGDRQGDDGYPEMAVATSTSEMIQAWAPGARVVKTPFSAAAIVEDPLRYGEPTSTFIASDDREAKEIVARIAIQLGFFPLDAGPLRMARAIDAAALLFLTPMMQGRDVAWISVPRIGADLSCISTEGWFEPVHDADDLAHFPNLDGVEVACPDE